MTAAAASVVILGAGAVGSYVGGLLADAGHDVTLIDPWPEHVEAIRRAGLCISGPDGDLQAHPAAWHLGEIHRLRHLRPVAAFLTLKLYDTAWAARLLATWLHPSTPVVTLQNGLAEAIVAGEVGWGRTIGAIGSQLHVSLAGPGLVRRARRRRIEGPPVFEIGEVHGRITPRATHLAALLDAVDTTAVTRDLWTHRWTKLCANAMVTGLIEAASVSGTSQDLSKRRPTEVDFINGFVAREGERLGVAVATNAAVAEMVREAEGGLLTIGCDAIAEIARRARQALIRMAALHLGSIRP